MTEDIVCSRIKVALAVYQAHGQAILAVPEIERRLALYEAAANQTQEQMQRTGVIAVCSSCAQKTGSCCFQEVESWYDPMLLLINLLLAGDIPRSRTVPDQCIFLGKKGCRLQARYPFCLNYFCPVLKKKLGPARMKTALAMVGKELIIGWELEQALYKWFLQHAPDALNRRLGWR